MTLITFAASVCAVALAVLFLRERAVRKAAEWDRRNAHAELDRREADHADQAERYQKAIEGCRFRTQEAIRERDAAQADLAELRKVTADAGDLAERLRAAQAARQARDDVLGFLAEWLDSEVRPLLGPRRAA